MADIIRNEKRYSVDNEKPSVEEPGSAAASTYAETSATSQCTSQNGKSTLASVSMHMDDRLRFLRFPTNVIDQCRSVILSIWSRGIQSERQFGRSHEIKLRGNPWRGIGPEATDARRLMKHILATLHSQGWNLMLSTDISKNDWDKDTLIFRFQQTPPVPAKWCSISFSQHDRLRFIDAPTELYSSIAAKLGDGWIQKQSEYAQGVWEMKLYGSPWSASEKETMKVRDLLLTLMEMLDEAGWNVYASVGQKSRGPNNNEYNKSPTDTWHCYRTVE